MSEHHQFIFPRYRHLQPPDWKGLEQRLLNDGLLEPAAAHARDETGDSEGCLWTSPLYRPSPALFRLLEVEPDEDQMLVLFGWGVIYFVAGVTRDGQVVPAADGTAVLALAPSHAPTADAPTIVTIVSRSTPIVPRVLTIRLPVTGAPAA